jgi:hypothetical protein
MYSWAAGWSQEMVKDSCQSTRRGSRSKKSRAVDKAVAAQGGALAGVRGRGSYGAGRRPRRRCAPSN